MSKIVVKLCSGTLCYVMGGAELQLLEDSLPDYMHDRVDIRGVTCLDFCNREGRGKAPFVMVGDIVVESATVQKIVDEITKQINGGN